MMVGLGGRETKCRSWKANAIGAASALALFCAISADAQSIQYTYDALGRVTSVVYADGSSVAYQYDSAGNRTAVTRTPDAPSVSNKTLTVAYNTAGTVNLTPGGLYNSVSKVANPPNGTVSISGTTATYTPKATFYGGTDTFQYYATGPGGNSPNATVTVTVGVPAAPTVSAKTKSVAYNTAGTVDLTPSGIYTSVSKVADPPNGTVSISGTTATYSPKSTFYGGTDTFQYYATGPGGNSPNATVTVTVGVPAAPTVSAKTKSVAYNTAGTVDLTPSGIYTSVSKVADPPNGTVSISGTTATYSPKSTFYGGTDTFQYYATGPGGNSPNATVTVTVGVPAAPTVSAKTLVVAPATAGTVNLAPSGVWTSVSLVSNASHGTASVNSSTGVATYTSVTGYNGSDSFTFKATGPGGTSGNGTVNVTINTAPVCSSQTNTIGGLPVYATATVGLSASQALALCTDANGDALTVTSPALPYSTTLAVGQASVTIPFTVSDGKGGTGSGSVTYKRP